MNVTEAHAQLMHAVTSHESVDEHAPPQELIDTYVVIESTANLKHAQNCLKLLDSHKRERAIVPTLEISRLEQAVLGELKCAIIIKDEKSW